MVKIKYNFNKMNGALKEAGAELNFKYKFNNPNFYKNSVISQFNKDGILTVNNEIEINFFGGLNFYKNLIVLSSFNEFKKKKNEEILIHFSKCEDYELNYEKKVHELNLHLPNSNIFQDDIKNKNFQKHKPCEKCLKIINWNNINKAEDWSRRVILEQFSVKSFYEHILPFQKELIANIHKNDFLVNLPLNFVRINEVIKAQKKWTCEVCKINTSGMKQLLHIEIKNILKDNINSSNYNSICSSCLKHRHNEISLNKNEIEFIKQFKPKT